MSDSIMAFRWRDENWRYFNYCRWTEQILQGKMNVYKGFLESPGSNGFPMGGNNIRFTSCLAFKKGNQKTKFMTDETKVFSGGILKGKEKFKEYIADNPETLADFERDDFKYYELESLIMIYNSQAETNK